MVMIGSNCFLYIPLGLEVNELFVMYLTVCRPLLCIKLIYNDVSIKSSMWSNDPPVLDHKSVQPHVGEE